MATSARCAVSRKSVARRMREGEEGPRRLPRVSFLRPPGRDGLAVRGGPAPAAGRRRPPPVALPPPQHRGPSPARCGDGPTSVRRHPAATRLACSTGCTVGQHLGVAPRHRLYPPTVIGRSGIRRRLNAPGVAEDAGGAIPRLHHQRTGTPRRGEQRRVVLGGLAPLGLRQGPQALTAECPADGRDADSEAGRDVERIDRRRAPRAGSAGRRQDSGDGERPPANSRRRNTVAVEQPNRVAMRGPDRLGGTAPPWRRSSPEASQALGHALRRRRRRASRSPPGGLPRTARRAGRGQLPGTGAGARCPQAGRCAGPYRLPGHAEALQAGVHGARAATEVGGDLHRCPALERVQPADLDVAHVDGDGRRRRRLRHVGGHQPVMRRLGDDPEPGRQDRNRYALLDRTAGEATPRQDEAIAGARAPSRRVPRRNLFRPDRSVDHLAIGHVLGHATGPWLGLHRDQAGTSRPRYPARRSIRAASSLRSTASE